MERIADRRISRSKPKYDLSRWKARLRVFEDDYPTFAALLQDRLECIERQIHSSRTDEHSERA